jgi:hypothetical protein
MYLGTAELSIGPAILAGAAFGVLDAEDVFVRDGSGGAPHIRPGGGLVTTTTAKIIPPSPVASAISSSG